MIKFITTIFLFFFIGNNAYSKSEVRIDLEGEVRRVSFSPEGKTSIIWDSKNNVISYDTWTNERLDLSFGNNQIYFAETCDSIGQFICVGFADYIEVFSFEGRSIYQFSSQIYFPKHKNKMIGIARGLDALIVSDLSGSKVRSFRLIKGKSESKMDVEQFQMSDNQRYIKLGYWYNNNGTEGNGLKVFDIWDEKVVFDNELSNYREHYFIPGSITSNLANKIIAFRDDENYKVHIDIINPDTGKVKELTKDSHNGVIFSILSEDGKKLILIEDEDKTSQNKNTCIKVYDFNSEQFVYEVKLENAQILPFTIAPNGQFLAYEKDSKVYVYNLKSKMTFQVKELDGFDVNVSSSLFFDNNVLYLSGLQTGIKKVAILSFFDQHYLTLFDSKVDTNQFIHLDKASKTFAIETNSGIELYSVDGYSLSKIKTLSSKFKRDLVSFSPKRDMIFVSYYDEVNETSSGLITSTNPNKDFSYPVPFSFVAWSPNANWVGLYGGPGFEMNYVVLKNINEIQ